MNEKEKLDYKRMIRDIEDAGGLEFMSFVDICDGDEAFYGKPNSDRRKWFQKKVNLLKRMRPDSYKRRVKSCDVTPSDATMENAERNSTPKFVDVSDLKDEELDDAGDEDFIEVDNKGEFSDEEDEESGDDEKTEAVHDLSNMLSGMGLSASTGSGLPSGQNSVRGSSVTPPRVGGRKTPPRKTSYQSVFMKEYKLNGIRGARGAIGSPTTVCVGNGTVETFVGSKQALQRIDVNVLFPERNFPFLIELVPEVLEGSLPLTVFDISVMVDYADVNKWQLKVPKGKPYNRVLCQIPALCYWHTIMEVYHKGSLLKPPRLVTKALPLLLKAIRNENRFGLC